jgi:hypothetical protein
MGRPAEVVKRFSQPSRLNAEAHYSPPVLRRNQNAIKRGVIGARRC